MDRQDTVLQLRRRTNGCAVFGAVTVERNQEVTIRPAANGFSVTTRIAQHSAPSELLVFQSYEALIRWLREHFTHRDTAVASDAQAT
jgi:hypothetical protein